MASLEVEKRCGCFTRSKLDASLKFSTKEQALKKAKEMLEVMNNDFCGKHKFKIVEENDTVKIVEDEENK